ncbi:alpha/beta hydrolase fold domain-containing protein [Listeria weihenstephanensis]|uniref:Alpha/beta hydrolase fold domain-containing protein n=1 Tax=Listeria weihenstephanensis TaxID=1006155 RepID=A0A841Z780_9LIST|nr:alpha/beta hydrolase [Listeria weihenstephanensis]MBC1500729.1 alpha/beta hydrolase fold domain-containing protein [Listeria weihenstephanensis]
MNKTTKKMDNEKNGKNKATRNWKTRLLSGISIFLMVFLLIVLVGVYFPDVSFVGEIGTIVMSLFSLHLVILSIVLGILAICMFRMGLKRIGMVSVIFTTVFIIGFSIPIVQMVQVANQYNAKISWTENLFSMPDMGGPDLTKSVKYATADDTDLYMDISIPKNGKTNNLTPIVLIHGGGFVAGTRNQSPSWTQFYLDRGYVVFDVDYRLAKEDYPTWDRAAPDVATAITWIGNHADKYNMDMDKLLVAGGSAGGSLALQVGYGLNDGTLKPYISGEVYKPKAVVAVYPAQNMTNIWYEGTNFFGMNGEEFLGSYIGGSPTEKPEAYAAIDVGKHITDTTPPTLIMVGKNDHLLPYSGQVAFEKLLNKNNVPNEFVAIPFNDHFFDLSGGSIGSQISYQAATDFLDKYEQ